MFLINNLIWWVFILTIISLLGVLLNLLYIILIYLDHLKLVVIMLLFKYLINFLLIIVDERTIYLFLVIFFWDKLLNLVHTLWLKQNLSILILCKFIDYLFLFIILRVRLVLVTNIIFIWQHFEHLIWLGILITFVSNFMQVWILHDCLSYFIYLLLLILFLKPLLNTVNLTLYLIFIILIIIHEDLCILLKLYHLDCLLCSW